MQVTQEMQVTTHHGSHRRISKARMVLARHMHVIWVRRFAKSILRLGDTNCTMWPFCEVSHTCITGYCSAGIPGCSHPITIILVSSQPTWRFTFILLCQYSYCASRYPEPRIYTNVGTREGELYCLGKFCGIHGNINLVDSKKTVCG